MAQEERIKELEKKVQAQEIKLAEGSRDFKYIVQELKEIKLRIKPFITVKAALAFGTAFGSPIAAAIMAVWGV